MFRPTTIRTRLLVCFVLVAVLPVIAASVGSLAVAYQTGRRQVGGRLESVAALKHSSIQGWIRSLEEDLFVASNTDCAFERITVVLTLAKDDKHYDFYNGAVRRRLQGLVGQSPHLEAVFLVDLEGKVALSTVVDEEGNDLRAQPFFLQGLAGPYAQVLAAGDQNPGDPSLQPCSLSMVVAMPVIGQQGRPVGIIAARACADRLTGILAERTGLGSTGKAYLVNQEGGVLAAGSLPSDGSGASGLAPSAFYSPGVDEALRERVSVSGLYRDHRGVLVLGNYRWLPEWNLVLSTEQDLAEGLYAVRWLILVSLAIAAAAVILAGTSAMYVTRTIAAPLAGLAETATEIARGNLDRQAGAARDDEIGVLAQAFNSMTAQLRDSISNLEVTVTERTRALRTANEILEQRALQLETSARVSRELTSILKIDDLLIEVVELIRDAFQYYHVHIYLLTSDRDHLVLRASSSQAVPEHQRISVTSVSINGKAIRSGIPVVVNDVEQEVSYLADQCLPGIKSELVVPLRLGDRAIGTLDVQSAELNTFTEEDILVIQSLADQIAVAIDNARLYDRSQRLAVMEERTRLARELHDSVTQSMYSVVLLTEGWRRSMRSSGGANVEEYLARICEINQQALREMRLLIHELRPPILEQDGLLGALHQRLDAVERRAGVEARLLTDEIVELPADVEAGLYRIAQEALNNALRHAHAANIVVRITSTNGRIALEVEDDGQGFDPTAIDVSAGMGLANMRHRAEELGGRVEIQSGPGQGTVVKVEIASARGS